MKRYKELKFDGKIYTEQYKIDEILIDEGFNWFLDCEVENCRIEILYQTLIFNAGVFFNGSWHYGVFRDGEWKNGIWENGVWYNGTWRRGTFQSGLIFDGKFFNGKILSGKIRGGNFYNMTIDKSVVREDKFKIDLVQPEKVQPEKLMESKVEGYWYSKYTPKYPKPIPNQLSEEEAVEIYKLIKNKEKSARLRSQKGFSYCRITGKRLGSGEYDNGVWKWPKDFAPHYVLKHKVKPSDEFLEYIGYINANESKMERDLDEFMKKIKREGFWYSDHEPNYPMPVPDQLSKEQSLEIYKLITDLEKKAMKSVSPGPSYSRITGEYLGSVTFHKDFWEWPGDFAPHYVLKHRVKPSDEFLEYIGYGKIQESFEPEEHWEENNETEIEPNKIYNVHSDKIGEFVKILKENEYVWVNGKEITEDGLRELIKGYYIIIYTYFDNNNYFSKKKSKYITYSHKANNNSILFENFEPEMEWEEETDFFILNNNTRLSDFPFKVNDRVHINCQRGFGHNRGRNEGIGIIKNISINLDTISSIGICFDGNRSWYFNDIYLPIEITKL